LTIPKITGIHPAAALFPRISGDEMDALAADIRENGLQVPITVTPAGEIVDGVNRNTICETLGIKPDVVVYEGDPVAYVISINIRRRHLMAGQRAMIEAKLTCTTGVGSLSTLSESAEVAGVGERLIERARYVVKYAPDLADQVIAGTLGFEPAYKRTHDRKLGEEAREYKLAELQRIAPDLAALVVEEGKDLEEMLAAARTRAEKAQAERRRSTRLIADLVSDLADLHGNEADTMSRYDPAEAPEGKALTATRFKKAAAVLKKWEELWRNGQE
jgi:hypothetical protein